VGIAEKVFKVRGQRSGSYVYECVCECYQFFSNVKDCDDNEGGIGLKFEVTDLHFVNPPDCKDGLDGPRDLDTRRRFDRFLMGALRQAWRVKRHPLQTSDDMRPLIGKLQRLPVNDIITRVIDLVEDRNRRIIDIDCDTNSLVCPSMNE